MKFLFSICTFFSIASFAADSLNPFEDENLKPGIYGIGNYLDYAQFIDPGKIHLIVEVGSRDAIDAIQLGYYYKCPVFAFECNPEGLQKCYSNTKPYPFVTIVPHACWNENKDIPFYPVVRSHDGTFPVNIGGSSCLVVRKDGADRLHEQGSPVLVKAVRLDSWMNEKHIKQIDLLVMDCQGATLDVLKGLGDKLDSISYLITEAYLTPAFEGEALYPEIRAFLVAHGFYPHAEPPSGIPFCDVFFINRNR